MYMFHTLFLIPFCLFQWFGFYKPGQSKELFTLFESQLYQEVTQFSEYDSRLQCKQTKCHCCDVNNNFIFSWQDWLGLKVMNSTGRLHFLASPGDHLQFTEQWFIDNIVSKFLKG